MARRSRNPKGQGQRLRDEILDAGMDVLAGVADARQVTIRAVAHAAEVTPPSIYLYFSDRAALLRGIIDRGFRLFDAFLEERTRRVVDPRRRLARMSRAYVEFADTHPGVYRVVFSAAGAGPAELGVTTGDAHPGRASLDALVAAVSACAADDMDPFPTTLRLWCFLHGLADLRLTKPELDWPDPQGLITTMLADLGIGQQDGQPGRSSAIAE